VWVKHVSEGRTLRHLAENQFDAACRAADQQSHNDGVHPLWYLASASGMLVALLFWASMYVYLALVVPKV
jgi:hypothetical protein